MLFELLYPSVDASVPKSEALELSGLAVSDTNLVAAANPEHGMSMIPRPKTHTKQDSRTSQTSLKTPNPTRTHPQLIRPILGSAQASAISPDPRSLAVGILVCFFGLKDASTLEA